MKGSSCKIIFMNVSEQSLYHRPLSLAERMFLAPRSQEEQSLPFSYIMLSGPSPKHLSFLRVLSSPLHTNLKSSQTSFKQARHGQKGNYFS